MAYPTHKPSYLYKIYAADPTIQKFVSKLDQESGFIHLSTAKQVPGTADRFFSSENTLWLHKISLTEIGNGLKWELSDGQSFPHLYRTDLENALPESLELMVLKREDGQSWNSAMEGLTGLEY
jgi:uncharacterized protein (DUF952 family)